MHHYIDKFVGQYHAEELLLELKVGLPDTESDTVERVESCLRTQLPRSDGRRCVFVCFHLLLDS